VFAVDVRDRAAAATLKSPVKHSADGITRLNVVFVLVVAAVDVAPAGTAWNPSCSK
jgi:hypothetical protein